jgi:hypothetical protein
MLQDSLNEALRAELTRLQATAAEALQQQGAPVSAGPPAGLPAGLAALGQPPAAGAVPQGGRSPALPPQPSSLGEIAAAAAGRARAQAAAAATVGGSGSAALASPPFDLATALAARGTAAAPASLGEQAPLWPSLCETLRRCSLQHHMQWTSILHHHCLAQALPQVLSTALCLIAW